MADGHDDNEEDVILDGVDDAMVADADTQTRPAAKPACRRRSRIFGKQGDDALNAARDR